MKSSVLQKHYTDHVIPQLKKELAIENVNALPRLEKVVVNVGVRQEMKTTEFMKTIGDTLTRITGQKPVFTRAHKSIASFKIREGMEIGAKVTLRGKRMDDFVTKLIHSTLPRVRDFRGLSLTSVDHQGNLTIGFKEHIVFPEINTDEVERIHGLSVILVSTAKTREAGQAFFSALGFPFIKNTKK